MRGLPRYARLLIVAGVLLGLVAGCLIILLAALISAGFSLFFFPLEKTMDKEGKENIRRLWLLTVIPGQWAVILSVCGIVSVVLLKLF